MFCDENKRVKGTRSEKIDTSKRFVFFEFIQHN